jgi:hypothetical protein
MEVSLSCSTKTCVSFELLSHSWYRGIASAIVTAVVEPIARGMKSAWSGSSEKVMDEVLKKVPIDRVKNTVKAYLYPQYEAACRSVAPQMKSYGSITGEKLVDMMKVSFMTRALPHAAMAPSSVLFEIEIFRAPAGMPLLRSCLLCCTVNTQ